MSAKRMTKEEQHADPSSSYLLFLICRTILIAGQQSNKETVFWCKQSKAIITFEDEETPDVGREALRMQSSWTFNCQVYKRFLLKFLLLAEHGGTCF